MNDGRHDGDIAEREASNIIFMLRISRKVNFFISKNLINKKIV